MTLPTETLLLSGLEHPAEILVDRWGIPHITAGSIDDAFFVQGFNAARDRLWQIDLWRKRGLGLLSADFGAAYLDRDRSARLLLYRGDMEAEWRAYGPEAERRTTAFVNGINAYVDLVERDPSRLPVEFRILGTTPDRWRPEDVVRCRAHARVRNLDAEILRSGIVARFGLEADRLHKGLQPPWTPTIPDGFTPHEIPPEVLRTYLLATEPVKFAPDLLDDLPTPAIPVSLPVDPDSHGSNNWALAPSRTTTGRAILASDPHRVHEMPSLRYVAHLSAPGLNVIGAGEPAVPGVSLGHNERIGFGLTIFPVDQEDLYVYELHPDDPDRYRYAGGWERMRVVTEPAAVRGGPDATHELRFTRHGPVLHVDRTAKRAYALRTVWTEPGSAAYLASLAYLQAENWEQFVAAMEGWGAPSVNHVYADVGGNIGWITAGAVPVRPNPDDTVWDGLMPVPGDGRYEWQGFLDRRMMPRSYNPARGWVGSANQMNLPEDFDFGRHKTCFEWSDDARYRRLVEGMEARERHSIADTKALQTDVTAVSARRLTALLRQAGAAGPAADLLLAWDCRLAAESGPAALFEVWFMRHLVPATLRRLGPQGLQPLIATPDTALIVNLLEQPDARFGEDPAAARDRLLTETLAAAWSETGKLLGDDPGTWAWGRLHQGLFEHPLSELAARAQATGQAESGAAIELNVGPGPKGGSGLTINNNGYRTTDFRVVSGVSWRMVLDVGNWDACWTVNAPGQSGDPASPHYRDLFDAWLREDYVPLLFSREAVEAAAELRIRLEPSPRPR